MTASLSYPACEPPFLLEAIRRGGALRSTERRIQDNIFVSVETEISLAGRMLSIRAGVSALSWGEDFDTPLSDPFLYYPTGIEFPLPEAGDLWFDLEAGYLFFGRVFLQDLEVGDPALDDRYIIRANHVDLLTLWLDADLRAAMLATYDPRSPTACRLRVRRGRAFLDASVAASAEENFAAILRLAQSLIERPQRLTQDWRASVELLDGRLTGVWQPDSSFALVWHDAGVDVIADVGHAPSWEGGRARWLRTRVRAQRLDGGAPFSLHADHLPRRWRPRVAGTRSPLPAADAPAIEAALASGDVVAVAGTRDEIVAVIPGAVHDPDRLRRAGALVVRLAGQRASRLGPYR